MFEAITAAGYIDRKSKKQEIGQMRIILHAGANKTDEDHLLYSLRRNLNLHHQNKIALPLPKNYRRPLRQRMMQSNHTAPDTDARDILLDVFLNGEPEECRTLNTGIPVFFWCSQRNNSKQALYPQPISNLVYRGYTLNLGAVDAFGRWFFTLHPHGWKL